MKQLQRLWQEPTQEYRMKTWWFFGYERTTDEGIRAILREPKADTFVTLNGLRMNVLRRGVVIKGGSKMITK